MGHEALRYEVYVLDDRTWGGKRFQIWDGERMTWADDLGSFLSYDAAKLVADHANLVESS
jgi:hypothetical protein